MLLMIDPRARKITQGCSVRHVDLSHEFPKARIASKPVVHRIHIQEQHKSRVFAGCLAQPPEGLLLLAKSHVRARIFDRGHQHVARGPRLEALEPEMLKRKGRREEAVPGIGIGEYSSGGALPTATARYATRLQLRGQSLAARTYLQEPREPRHPSDPVRVHADTVGSIHRSVVRSSKSLQEPSCSAPIVDPGRISRRIGRVCFDGLLKVIPAFVEIYSRSVAPRGKGPP